MTEVVQIPKRETGKDTDPFFPGQSVWLKCGGPAMTVRSYQEAKRGSPGRTETNWFIEAELQHGDFVPEQLTSREPVAPK